MVTEEQQKILNFMKAMKENFDDVEFRITLPSGMKLRTAKFRCKNGQIEYIPYVPPKPLEKKNGIQKR